MQMWVWKTWGGDCGAPGDADSARPLITLSNKAAENTSPLPVHFYFLQEFRNSIYHLLFLLGVVSFQPRA